MESLTLPWSGVVTPEVMEPLAQAIKEKFTGRPFSTMFDQRLPEKGQEVLRDTHRRLTREVAYCFLGDDNSYIRLIAYCQWNIHLGEYVVLSERMLFSEKIYPRGEYKIWSWILEGVIDVAAKG